MRAGWTIAFACFVGCSQSPAVSESGLQAVVVEVKPIAPDPAPPPPPPKPPDPVAPPEPVAKPTPLPQPAKPKPAHGAPRPHVPSTPQPVAPAHAEPEPAKPVLETNPYK